MSWHLPGGGPSNRRIARTEILPGGSFAGSCSEKRKGRTKRCDPSSCFAERRGFEPLKPFRGLLAFQAGQFNHSCIFPDSRAKIDKLSRFCKCLLPFFGGAEPRRKESSASAAAASVRMQKKPRTGRACGADAPEGSELESERHGHGVLHVVGAVDVARVRTRERAVRCDLVGIIE